ncbi:hypothetical protein [Burkholderia glumae]|uniref:Peptide-binding protein n=2 Tax=Burkholderia glumae TaxID=337 RepID=A0ABY5BLG5_BURGL|nr:hypothetical protein [Burkholderia glumae]ACR29119.1 Hypothetical protein bglu_1g20100 [Burkholderia glumae BGR1]AJY66160.1 hypothetical protein KS03_2865 [Burkholderia glumae LMG 2196 = ATCC 33617]MCM2483046.1 hypothetical protein [Burkholderia glumae]MCM2493504.1 hypothetical protein [Burkholderia glumae]MCM2506362.1 hypothetical protein [Burkholderia glumae]
MRSNMRLATTSLMLALALVQPARADRRGGPPFAHHGQAGHVQPQPAPPAAPPNVVPRGDLRGDIASNVRGRNAAPPAPPLSSGFAPHR